MRVTVWGARGSIPVSGPEYLRFGGDTTCLEIESASGEILIVDAGTGIRRAGHRLYGRRCRRVHLLLTHAHWDHVVGFPFFRPLYAPGTRVEILGGRGLPPAREILGRVMSAPVFPVALGELAADVAFAEPRGAPFEVAGLRVATIPISHPNGGVGYAFEEAGRRLVFLTDNELGLIHPGGRPAADYVRFAAGADLLLHDGEFTAEEYRTRRGWGHSTWEEALDLALEAGAARLGLWHHNMERSDAELDRIAAACGARAGAAGSALEVFAASQLQHLDV